MEGPNRLGALINRTAQPKGSAYLKRDAYWKKGAKSNAPSTENPWKLLITTNSLHGVELSSDLNC